MDNTDNAFTLLRKTKQFRGKPITIKETYLLNDSLDDPLIPSNIETYTLFDGVIDSISLSVTSVVITATNQATDILDKDFPLTEIDTAEFPEAIDLGFVINEVYGTAKLVPCSLILPQDTPSVQWDYTVGWNSINNTPLAVGVVYRNGLIITEFLGTAQTSTSTTIKLASATTQNDDFFNETFVEILTGPGAGEIKRITDYVGSTDVATVESAWSVTPTASSTYAIREWRWFTATHTNGRDYTGIRFAISQRDGSGALFTRDTMAADVVSVDTNPVLIAEKAINLLGGTVESASVTATSSSVVSEGSLFVGGALTEKRKTVDILEELGLIGRFMISLAPSNQFLFTYVETASVIKGEFDDTTKNNILSIGVKSEASLFNLWKTVAVKYRNLHNENNLILTTALHNVITEGKVDEIIEFPLIYNKTTADKVADFLAQVQVSLDSPLTAELNHEARGLGLLDMLNLAPLNTELTGSYQISSVEFGSGIYGVSLIPAITFIRTAGAEPADEIFDNGKDFRFTPAKAVTSLGGSWSGGGLNLTAARALTWVIPVENYKGALVEYKVSTDSLYETFVTTTPTDTNVTVTGLTSGLNYDFRVTSINLFDDLGGSASITSTLAPGDTTAPSTPGTPSAVRKFRTWSWEISPVSGASAYDWEVRTSGGTLVTTLYDQGTQISYSSSGTATVTWMARARSKDLTGNTSAYGAYSTSISNEDLTGPDIGNGTIDSGHYVTASIDTAHIGNLQVTTAKIGDLQVTTAKIGNLQVTTAKIGTLQVDTAQIASLSVETLKIGDDDVDSFKHQVLATANHNNLQPGTLSSDTVWRSSVKTTTHGLDGPLTMGYTTTDNFSSIGSPTAATKVTLATFMVTNSTTAVATIATMGNHAGSQSFTGLDADLAYKYW